MMVRAAALVLATLCPGRLRACAVCFASTDPGIGRAYSLGILVLMGFTFLILGALAFVVYRIETRRAAADRALSLGSLS